MVCCFNRVKVVDLEKEYSKKSQKHFYKKGSAYKMKGAILWQQNQIPLKFHLQKPLIFWCW